MASFSAPLLAAVVLRTPVETSGGHAGVWLVSWSLVFALGVLAWVVVLLRGRRRA